MSMIDIYVRDKNSGKMHRVGDDIHDMLTINDDGQLCYHNLQNGDGCHTDNNIGGYEFVPNQDEYGYNCVPTSRKELSKIPSAQPEPCDDAVSREEAKWVVFCNRDHVEDQANAIDALPPVTPKAEQPDMSEYSDKLWKRAYERGKAEAQDEIVRCKECRHRDPEDHKCDCGHDIIWQLPRDDKWYCADAERRTDG